MDSLDQTFEFVQTAEKRAGGLQACKENNDCSEPDNPRGTHNLYENGVYTDTREAKVSKFCCVKNMCFKKCCNKKDINDCKTDIDATQYGCNFDTHFWTPRPYSPSMFNLSTLQYYATGPPSCTVAVKEGFAVG